MVAALTLVDVRAVPLAQRHPLVFGSLDARATGRALELFDDHDPLPLNHQFQPTRAGQFDWQYLQAGPQLLRVRVAGVADGAPGGVTRGCGGGGGCACSG